MAGPNSGAALANLGQRHHGVPSHFARQLEFPIPNPNPSSLRSSDTNSFSGRNSGAASRAAPGHLASGDASQHTPDEGALHFARGASFRNSQRRRPNRRLRRNRARHTISASGTETQQRPGAPVRIASAAIVDVVAAGLQRTTYISSGLVVMCDRWFMIRPPFRRPVDQRLRTAPRLYTTSCRSTCEWLRACRAFVVSSGRAITAIARPSPCASAAVPRIRMSRAEEMPFPWASARVRALHFPFHQRLWCSGEATRISAARGEPSES